MAFILEINSVDVTEQMVKGSLQITEKINDQPNELMVEVEDPSSRPVQGQVVKATLDGTAIFAGILDRPIGRRASPTRMVYSCQAIDYQRVLEYRLAVTTYTSKTCLQIIQDLVSNYVDSGWGFTTNNVETGPTIDSITFNYKRVSDCIRQLAEIAGFHWFVDEDKDIHFFASGSESAPLILDENSYHFKDINFEFDFEEVVNDVVVVGGTFLSAPVAESNTTVSGETSWAVSDRPENVSITFNGAAQTVGTYNIDAPSTKHFLVEHSKKTIHLGSQTIAGSETLVITYNFMIKVIVEDADTGSQVTVAAIEGGDGRHDGIIIDNSINTIDDAEHRASAELSRNANPKVRGGFGIVYTGGWKAGQVLTVNFGSGELFEHGNGAYVIDEVIISSYAPGKMHYAVRFSSLPKERNVVGQMAGMVRFMKETTLEGASTLYKISSATEDMEIDDATLTIDVGTDTYLWGVTPSDFDWGFGQWA